MDGTVGVGSGDNTFFAMRDVAFTNVFQTLYANSDTVLDFVLCFEEVTLACAVDPCTETTSTISSCTLINAYSMNDIGEQGISNPFSSVLTTLVNQWYNNRGDTIPTFLRVRGSIKLESPIDDSYDSIGLFFDGNLVLDQLVDQDTTQPSAR
jgi:hypothetical protein